MEKIIQHVDELSLADKRAIEHILGIDLAGNEQITIRVSKLDTPPSAFVENADEQIPEAWKIYEGLSDEEVDKLDRAIRQRANLTRNFE
ncbi:hypothetical protein BH10PLA2_BH10PLA2_02200 [soil metagenome]